MYGALTSKNRNYFTASYEGREGLALLLLQMALQEAEG